MASKPFHLAWFLGNSFGVHGWKDPWGGRTALDWASPSLQIDLARAAERACMDFVFFEDSVFVPDNYGSSMDFYLKRALRAPKNDPMPLVPLVAQATRHIGIIPTISTSFYPPYLLARLMATLDLMSEGRVGCNFVTSTAARAAQNFGLDEHIDHDTRYEMADEFVEVVKKLWTSWDADAIVADEERAVFAEPGKVRTIDFEGRFFKSRGPLNTARPPQGTPVLAQAGGSPQGRAFAARHMDVVIAAVSTVQEMKAYRQDLRQRAARNGRDPDHIKVMFQVMPLFGDTDQQAREHLARHRAGQDPAKMLAAMGSLFDIDFSTFDLDAPLAELTTNGQQGTLKRFLSYGRTLREIAGNFTFGLENIAGTPESVASQLAELMEEVGGDGFVIAGPMTRRYIAEVTDGLAAVLQRRGLTRERYTHRHFRDHLMEF
ncbi:NtaA/DmoA family FMN-dependent monooxygenase [Verticiella sediminum]|uniref:NtaA/DmoA family FMN-dependent monooxygenase n=1 Tax=Verticiella sediminum TaxID=1247510 RepID=A0A556AIU2_9BURK|nr:NtaA/DmoA family FMN-dependent monooxygenase [Verticiella sediminum]TSH92791.1 NtaA/DmoA family FMN-dependent monooxygenase [Verticiella sediminum]